MLLAVVVWYHHSNLVPIAPPLHRCRVRPPWSAVQPGLRLQCGHHLPAGYWLRLRHQGKVSVA